jgi:hypothetical protein
VYTYIGEYNLIKLQFALLCKKHTYHRRSRRGSTVNTSDSGTDWNIPWSYHRKSYFFTCQLSKRYISYNRGILNDDFGIFWKFGIRTLRLEKENCIYNLYSCQKSAFNRCTYGVLTKYESMWVEKRKSYFGKNKVTHFLYVDFKNSSFKVRDNMTVNSFLTLF